MEGFPLWREEDSETRGVGGETDRPLPSCPGFGKNVKFPPSFANFAKMQNSHAKPFDIST